MAKRSTDTLYLVDGTAQLFRAYFAIRGLTNDEGLPTNAIYGFTTMLRKLLREEDPQSIGVAFDLPGKVFRNDWYPDYKAHRPPTPSDLNQQLPYAKQVCEVLGLSVLECPRYEADDLIASYAARARKDGSEVVVVASDKDLLQLVGDGVRVFNPTKEIWLDSAGVDREFGVPPVKVLDVQGLMGDSVDNIPGVPGVGGKTALAIISRYGDLEAAIARAGRFVTLFEARDTLLETIDAVDRSAGADDSAVAALVHALQAVEAAANTFLADEADEDLAGRLTDAMSAVETIGVGGLAGAIAAKGKAAIRPVKALKKLFKALDKGSARKVWTSIDAHADDARLSKKLATLNSEMTDLVPAAELKRRPADRPAAAALFGDLGFRTLVPDYEGPERTATEAVAKGAKPGASAAGAAEAGDSARDSAADDGPHEIAATPAELAVLGRTLEAAETISIAIETDSGDPMRSKLVGVAFGIGDGRAWYVPIGHDYLGVPEQPSIESVREALAAPLAHPAIAKVAHDTKSLAHVLRRHGFPVPPFRLDTMVGAFLLDAGRSGYGVESVAAWILDRELPSRGDSFGSGVGRKSPAELEVGFVGQRTALLADAIGQLADRVTLRLAEAELSRLYETIDGPMLPVLERMEARGILVDTDVLAQMSDAMEQNLERLGTRIHELAGREFNVDSPKQLREVLFDDLGLKPRRKTAKSKVASTDAQTLEELAEDHEIARLLLEYRETAKLKGTYVDSLPRLVNPETGRVHTSFHPTGAATGRLSSSDPNLQNIPVRTEAGRQIRSAFVAPEGKRFLASDYSQIELRVLAHMCGDEQLIAAFQAGEDIHRYTAARVFGVLPDLVTDEMRRRAKAVNFGLLYGMSETRLAREQGMARGEARKFVEAYFDRFAAVRGYIDRVRAEANEQGRVVTLFGRVRPFPQLQQRVHRGIREQALRAAVNTTIQGTAADLMKIAMIQVDEALAKAGLEAEILLQVHDELLLEVPEDELETTGQQVRQAMESVYPLAVPLVVDQKIGRTWRDA